ncbi:hypothetical protein Plhal710r2_c007g0032061 [Plasmopara halstedii]
MYRTQFCKIPRVIPLWKAVMRVYVFVAIVVRGVSFCFAVQLGEKNCNGLDTNSRNPLCTPPQKAYTIRNGALRHNVALVENEAHVDDKENEARGVENVIYSRVILEPHLPGDKINEIQRLLSKPFVTNTANVDRNKIVESIHDLNIMHNNMLAEDTGLKFDKIIEKWFLRVIMHRNFHQGRDKFDDDQLLLTLLEVIDSQNLDHSIPRVINVLENFRAKPEFRLLAEDVERIMISKPELSRFVFSDWIKNNNTPKNALRILLGDRKSNNFDFLRIRLWLDYVDYIRDLYAFHTKSNSVPSSIIPSRNGLSDEVESMQNQQKIFEQILLESELVFAHLIYNRWVHFFEKCLISETLPDVALKTVRNYQQALSDNIELITVLDYVIRYRKNHQYPDIKLYELLTSKRLFDEVVDQLKSIDTLKKSFSEAAGRMLYSMISAKDIMTVFVKAKITGGKYRKWLDSLYAMFADSEPMKVTTSQSAKQKNVDKSNAMYAESGPTKVTTLQELTSIKQKNKNVLNAMHAKSRPTKVTTFQELFSTKPKTRDVLSSKPNDHRSIYEHGNTPVVSTNKAHKRKRDDQVSDGKSDLIERI